MFVPGDCFVRSLRTQHFDSVAYHPAISPYREPDKDVIPVKEATFRIDYPCTNKFLNSIPEFSDLFLIPSPRRSVLSFVKLATRDTQRITLRLSMKSLTFCLSEPIGTFSCIILSI